MIITTKRRTDKNGNTYIYCYVGARKSAAYKLCDPAGCGYEAHQRAAKDLYTHLTNQDAASALIMTQALPDACNHDFVHEVS